MALKKAAVELANVPLSVTLPVLTNEPPPSRYAVDVPALTVKVPAFTRPLPSR